MTAITREGKTANSSFDVSMLRQWLAFLEIDSYDVAYTRDLKFKTWTGPVLALGHNAHREAVRLGKKAYLLPHPRPDSAIMGNKKKAQALLKIVKNKMKVEGYLAPKKLKVIREAK